MSSLIPSVSILVMPGAPGEGGGVLSYVALPLLLGRSAKETFLVDVAVDDRGRVDDIGDGKLEVCARFTFLVGGCCVSVVMEDLEREGR